MRKRIKKEDYMSEEAKQLEQQLKDKLAQDKCDAECQRIVEKIPMEKREGVLRILSRNIATK